MDYKQQLDDIIGSVLDNDVSDIHLGEGRQVVVRVDGFLIPLVKTKVMTKTDIKGFVDFFLNDNQKEKFVIDQDIDFAYDYNKDVRFRGNIFTQLGKISIALRLIPKKIKTFKDLKLPDILESFANKQQGFFLVVGPSNQGKSTTLASMVEHINSHRLEHIVTIEDPVEYIFESKKAIIDQREVRQDTPDFKVALKGVFRQDIDVLMIGEMREAETMATAVTAAETGHLVFSTLHTNTASQTVARIIDSFQAEQQNQIRLQLASSLIGIFSQRLIPAISGGMVPCYELLINNSAVSNLIRENRTHEIDSVIETGRDNGMIDFNRTLADLVRSGIITIENAYMHSTNPKSLERLL